MVWAWMLWGPNALGTRTLVWFGHGSSAYRMHSEQHVIVPLPTPHPPPNAKSETRAKQGTEIPPCAYTRRNPPCNSGIIGIQKDPNIILLIPYCHYYWVGGPPNTYTMPSPWLSHAVPPSTPELKKIHGCGQRLFRGFGLEYDLDIRTAPKMIPKKRSLWTTATVVRSALSLGHTIPNTRQG